MSSPPTPITDPGVTVATGDPARISAAGDWHYSLASTLESHSSLIRSSAGALLTGWTGEASRQYQTLSAEMSGHYEVTAAQAHATASALRRFSAELDHAQGEGRVALQNAIYWMNEVNHWQNKLSAAQDEKAKAQTKVQTAMTVAATASHAASVPHAAAGAAAAAQQANQNLQAARDELKKAEMDEATAKKHLIDAADHFAMWQQKGGQALQEAELAAGVAGLALGAVAISSPPAAGTVNAVPNRVSATVARSGFAGSSASGGGGSSLSGGQGDASGQAIAGGQGSGIGATAGGSALTGAAGIGASGSPKPGAGDVNPLPGFTLGRTDMGVDANAAVGTPILAPNTAKVVGILGNWYDGQPYVALQLLAGPNKGKVMYVAEQITGIPQLGQVIQRGQPIARYAPSGTGIEIGWASPTNPLQTLAQAVGNTGGAGHSDSPSGQQFRNYLGSVGAG